MGETETRRQEINSLALVIPNCFSSEESAFPKSKLKVYEESRFLKATRNDMAKSSHLIVKPNAACLRQRDVLHHVLQLLLFFRFFLL